jgi:hypothetical protein
MIEQGRCTTGLTYEEAAAIGLAHEHPDHPKRHRAARRPPRVLSVERPFAGRYVVTVADWRPASKNVKARGLKAWIGAKRRDREALLPCKRLVPCAAGRRRVRCAVTMPGNLCDPINLTESLADALVSLGLLRDDSQRWAEVVTPTVGRGKETVTVVELEDV